jgi:hypothetical protein
METNKYIENNWQLFTEISKRVLNGRWGEGLSEYSLYLLESNKVPPNPPVHCYYYMKNLSKSNSKINYKPLTFQNKLDFDIVGEDPEDEINMRIDFNDPELVDFLLHNELSDKWIKIFKVVHRGEVHLDLFEQILFEYIFLKGYSAKKISEITGNSVSWVFGKRKKLILKIKEKIC